METIPIILASGSQRRQRFLQELGLDFSVVVADIDETPLPGEHPGAMTWRLAEEKAREAARRIGAGASRIIVASDTTVALGDVIYGKPVDAADAVRMLADLRNGPHQVISAVSVLRLPDDRQTTRINTTTVFMRDYSDAEIAAYVATDDPLDKAGAYAIQAQDFACVAALEGCHASVMGLPLADLRDLLAEFGVGVPVPVAAVCGLFNTLACCARDPAPLSIYRLH